MVRHRLWRGEKIEEHEDVETGEIHRWPTPPKYTEQEQRVIDLNEKIKRLLE